MTAEQLQSLIAAGLPCEHLEVTGDGRHWAAVIVSPGPAPLIGMLALAWPLSTRYTSPRV